MTYPQQPGYPMAPPQPQQPQYQPPAPQGYAPPPMGYPAPQYPAQQPGYPAGPPQGYPMAQPPVQLATGSLDAFYSQPSVGGGAALKFEVGTTHVGVVSRDITSADVQQQTNPQNGQPAYFKDGRPKFVMKVPLQVQPSQDRPDGLAQWYVAGAARDELARAMKAAGAPEGPPEAGALIQVTCTGTRPSGAGMNPSKVYQVVYQRPQGTPAAPPQQPAAQPPAPPQMPQQVPAPQYQAPAPQYQAPAPPVPQQVAQPPAPPAPQQVAPAQPPAPQFDPSQLPAMGADQQALLAQLTGQQPVAQG